VGQRELYAVMWFRCL